MSDAAYSPVSAVLAEVRETSDLHRAMRDRADQLNITRLELDHLAGLTPGYSGKVLSPTKMKSCVGPKTLGPLLGGLGLKLLVVEDPDSLARIQRRLEPRSAEHARWNNHNHQIAKARQMTETPKYKLVAPDGREFVTFMNMPARTGTVVEFPGWPDLLHMEPTNEPARRIYEFHKAHQFDSAKPPTPHDPIGCAIYLPVLDGGYREGKKATPDMPRYVPRTHNFEMRSRFVPVGVEFAWVAWPTFGIEPANEPAERVAEYLEAQRDHPRLPLSPWNDYDDTLWLPELPEIKKGPGGTILELQPFATSSHVELRRGRLTNAPAAIPAATSKRSATRRRVSA